ncbi:RNA polymerase sigma factor [Clostridium beijerinckii]|uniref:RNA polymerase sigma factor n=1 Tax=Clostridium beijerinckii TaxID=1520 RepID=UPI00098C202D|nr:sigma factor-like helix-turn-helix DNA-binding protein [Clostridium beijerinckii]NRT79931.1 toxin-associated regulator BotR [Clostridium beijerinckii]OOM43148.1 RNA polymerase sigma factor [Clostridium beijerinckii]
MDIDLLEKLIIFQKNKNNFMEILSYFNPKIKYLSYKLKYSEAEIDLIIFLYELIAKINLYKFVSSTDALRYIKRCLRNQAIGLSYKVNRDKNFLIFNSDDESLESFNKNNSNDYSDIFFNDLISSLKPRQKQIVYYKFYMQLSDIEIGKILKISRQSVNTSKRVSLNLLKTKLYMEG